MPYKYSIIVPVRNNISFFIRHFNGIINADFSGSVEYIVIDDASPDSTPKFLESAKSKITNPLIDFKMIRNTEQLGQIKSQNKALDVVSGEYIIKMDSDAVLHKDWESKVLKYFTDDSVIAVGPCGSYVWPDWSNFNYRGDSAKPNDYVDGLTGFFIMWKNIKPAEWRFDESFGLFWHEEFELELRIKLDGYRFKKCEMCVEHLCQTGDWKLDPKIWELEKKNRLEIVRKYKPLVESGKIKLETPPN